MSAVASATSSGKPSQVAPETKNMDLINMLATFDYGANETAWQQGLPPGLQEAGPQISGLDLSDSDGDGSDTSIFSMYLDGFDGDAWMPDAEEVQADMQVGETEGVNYPAHNLWRTTVGLQPEGGNGKLPPNTLVRR